MVAVCGTTAAGKSALAIALAKRLSGEVINTDAMQMYRGFDVTTNKVTPDESMGVKHHLLGILEPGTRYTVVDFEKDAKRVVFDESCYGL